MFGSVNAERKKLPSDSLINLDNGDPTMFEEYWQNLGDKGTLTITGSQCLSYFSDPKSFCWFLEPELKQEIQRLHSIVGNAVTDDRYIIVGTGSSQLFQAALYALSSPDSQKPTNVVSAVPYYSCYPDVTDYLKSGLYKWGGDAESYDKDEPYIEVVTTPNNPDGNIREPVVRSGNGKLIYDFAYYWPHYTPITSPADHDVMLFTASKCTGHAGTRIGWAIVKNRDVAEKMKKYIEISTIGVSKESQLRVATLFRAVSDSCQKPGVENFFEFGCRQMTNRWERIREVIHLNGLFSLPEYPTEFCQFSGELMNPHPAFAWLESKGEIEDGADYFKCRKILTRTGTSFGVSSSFVRVSMVGGEEPFNLLLERLSTPK